MIKSIFAVVALACMSVLSCAARVVEGVGGLLASIIPTMTDAKPAFILDNGHPRSPLASLRAGVA
ncbi:hypothetical protein JQK15_03880 [Sphingobium sp. BHU LFT2]|uniref:hypothetical protein n=1 Tax=Sphingobium sp. BHU LFT2 TaxID=2807634 RepID=UPI001BEC670A|nr:hypothetical protein [Sphingobium sp. BHU LFT2]MBT2242668.1 hypothetical protein [Sphingobium sp. BHU LFT2]